MRFTFNAIYILTSLMVLGCAEVTDSRTSCERAAEHMEQCFGGISQQTSCVEEDASRVVEMSCDELNVQIHDTKSDVGIALARQSCEWGFYQFCNTPQCSAEADEPPPQLPSPHIDFPSQCAVDALKYEGCGACEYYTCREREAQCGKDGYLLNYAYRYCNRFRLTTEPNVSEKGQLWLRKIRRCLITTLDQVEPDNYDCRSINDKGFGSHPSCYVDTGFCALPISDWIAVLNTIDTLDFNFRESFITGHKCVEDWINGGKF